MSPVCCSTASASRFASGRRTSAVTVWPVSLRRRAIARPRKPVAPVSSTRIDGPLRPRACFYLLLSQSDVASPRRHHAKRQNPCCVPSVSPPVLFSLVCAAPARATQEFSGSLPSGAYYHVEIPDGWHSGGTVVFYQHGLDFTTPSDTPGLGPLKSVMLAEGYAVAATSYRQRGWALFTAMDDNRDLLAVFDRLAGAPGEVVPFGGSLGGLIALKLAEAPGFPPVRGTFALCPAAGGARLWDGGIDLRLAFDVVCGADGAGEFPVGDPPLPWAINLEDIPDGLGDLLDDTELLPVLLPLEQCTGVNLPPILRNDAMQRRLDELMTFAHITDEDFFVTDIGYATYVLSDLVRAPDKLDGRNPFTTLGVDYSSDPLIAGEHSALRRRSSRRGRAASGFRFPRRDRRRARCFRCIPAKISSSFPATRISSATSCRPISARSRSSMRTAPTHCGFTEAEGLAGWEALARMEGWRAATRRRRSAAAMRGHRGVRRWRTAPAGSIRMLTIVPFDDIVRPRPAVAPPMPGHSTARAAGSARSPCAHRCGDARTRAACDAETAVSPPRVAPSTRTGDRRDPRGTPSRDLLRRASR